MCLYNVKSAVVIIHRSRGILLHEGALSSVILLGEGGEEKLRSTISYIY